ncbi:MAG: hypothetical protein RIS83_325, partial [Pseudomonadota bacterium]
GNEITSDESQNRPPPPLSRKKASDDLKDHLRKAFCAELPLRLQTLEAAYAQQDLPALSRFFHNIKGSAGFIWPKGDLVKLSEVLEKSADRSDWLGITQELGRFQALLKEMAEGTDA